MVRSRNIHYNVKRKFSIKMIDFLRNNSTIYDINKLTSIFNEEFCMCKDVSSIKRICQKYDIKIVSHTRYKKEMIDFLRDNAYGETFVSLTKKFNKQFNTNKKDSQIRSLCKRHGIASNSGNYSDEMMKFLADEYMNYSRIELAKKFNSLFKTNRTVAAIQAICNKNKLIKQFVYTDEMKEYIRNETQNMSADERAINFNKKFGLSINKKELQTICYRFKLIKVKQKIKVGAERPHGNGFIKIKIAEPNKWELKHLYLWKKRYGPIPDGHTIIFADGNKNNYSIDNLYCIKKKYFLFIIYKGYDLINVEILNTYILLAKLYEKIFERKKEIVLK